MSLETTLSLKINACSADHIGIDRTVSTSSGSLTIHYTFFLNNYMPSSITVSDATLQQNIADTVKIDSSRSLSGLITDIMQVPLHVAVVVDSGHEGTANMISVLENFQKYFKIKPNDVAEKD